jgi:prepilin-type N-terminal cleavage/methylation domain-containing protein
MSTLIHPPGRRGFTVVEVILAMSLVSMAGLMAYRIAKRPQALNQGFIQAELDAQAQQAIGLVAADLKEAYLPSVPFNTLPPAPGADPTQIAFSKPIFTAGEFLPSGQKAYVISYDVATRSLRRSIDGVPDAKPLFKFMNPPTTSQPLVAADTSGNTLNVLIVTLAYQMGNLPTKRVVRRVVIGG